MPKVYSVLRCLLPISILTRVTTLFLWTAARLSSLSPFTQSFVLEHHNTSNNRGTQGRETSATNNHTSILSLVGSRRSRGRTGTRGRRGCLHVVTDQLGQVSVAGVSSRDARAVLACAGHVGVGALDEVDDGALVWLLVDIVLAYTAFCTLPNKDQKGKTESIER